MSTLTAGPLDQKHKYHMFFAYHPSNKEWLQELVQRLEAEPWAYKCCYADRDFDSRCTSTQNVLCSIMLSHRIVVLLTPRFIKDQWNEYEESLAHLASMTLRKQRVIPIILEETNIPDSLRMLRAVDARREDFWDVFLQNVCLDGLTFSDSMHTIRSLSSQSSVSGFVNGQVLTSLTATVNGFIKSQLLFDYEEVPDPLIKDDINLSRQEFADLVKIVGHEDAGQRLSWLFTALPTILLAILFALWCVAFILVILLFPDDAPSTLPVRLCVFSLPAVFIVLGCVLRWRKLKTHKEQYSVSMFSRSVAVNQLLYERSKPVIITTARTNEDTFHIYFLYYNMADCVERVKIFLTHCTDEDIVKLAKLIEVYTLHTGYLEGKPLAIRLAVMMSAAFAIQTVFKRLPHAIEQRHTRRRQCLCQFIEEFLAAYLPCIRTGADLANVKFLFLKYLNCHIQPEPVILHALGISITEVS